MKVAVLFFGQPRFFDITVSFFKRYFEQLDNVDYFAHFWDSIKYRPHQPEELLDRNKLDTVIQLLNPITYKIQNYDPLDRFVETIIHLKNIFNNSFSPVSHNYKKHYYQYGQYCSLSTAFSLMEAWETKNKFKYDVVVKIRTDYILNKQNIHDLITFTTDVPTLRVVSWDYRKFCVLKKNKQNNHILQPECDRIGMVLGHLWTYNRSGADMFLKNHWLYYFNHPIAYKLNRLHESDFVNFIQPAIFGFKGNTDPLDLDPSNNVREFSGDAFNTWVQGTVLPILIHGLEKNSNIELFEYNIKRVINSECKNKFKTGYVSRYSAPILTDYKLFNDDNSKYIKILDDYIKTL